MNFHTLPVTKNFCKLNNIDCNRTDVATYYQKVDQLVNPVLCWQVDERQEADQKQRAAGNIEEEEEEDEGHWERGSDIGKYLP